jgi:glycosyltransferase involved in cell wall biosynthesis
MNDLPDVTIVVPCRDERQHVAECLDSIVACDYPKDALEVLVVDGMSEDGTADVLDAYARRFPFVHVLKNPARTTPCALNVGIRAARGKVVVRMDAHSVFPATYVSDGVACLRETGADLAGGPVTTRPGAETIVGRAVAYVTSHPFGVGNSRFRTSSADGDVDTVPFGAFRRDTFDRFGLFDERLARNQDNELCSRIRSGGGRIYMTARMRADYYNQATARGLFRQAFRAGMWNVETLRANPRAFKARHFAPFAFLSALAALGPALALWPAAGHLLLAGVGLYAAIAVAVAVHAAPRVGVRVALLLPALFFGYHASYGAGTWYGLLRPGAIRPAGSGAAGALGASGG